LMMKKVETETVQTSGQQVANQMSSKSPDRIETSRPISKSEKLEKLERVMLDAYKLYQDTNKHHNVTTRRDVSRCGDDVTHQRLLAESYHNYFEFANGKENGVPPVVKVETITDSQVPSLLDKAIKFCQMKIKKDKPSQSSSVTSQTTNQEASNQKKPLVKLTPKPKIVLTTTPPGGNKNKSAFHQFKGVGQQQTSGVMLVQKEGQKPYTKITSSVKPPLKRQNFDNLKIPDQHHGLEGVIRSELRRSSSVPSNNQNNKQKLFRTGSQMVAGSTLYRLKTSIRNGTSAALIRKPSITDQEIIQISDENSDSSDSDFSDSEDSVNDVTNFNYDVTNRPSTSALVPPPCKKSKPPTLDTQTSPTATLKVVMTTAAT